MKAIGDFFGRANIPLLVGGGLLFAIYIGWIAYATSEWGVDRGVGVLVAWPALLLGAAIVLAPFVGAGLLIKRLVGESEGDEDETKAEDEKPEEPKEGDEDEAAEDEPTEAEADGDEEKADEEEDGAEEKEEEEADGDTDEDEDGDEKEDADEEQDDDEKQVEDEKEVEDAGKDANEDEDESGKATGVEKPPLPEPVSDGPSLFDRVAAAVVVRVRRLRRKDDEKT